MCACATSCAEAAGGKRATVSVGLKRLILSATLPSTSIVRHSTAAAASASWAMYDFSVQFFLFWKLGSTCAFFAHSCLQCTAAAC